MNKKEPTFTEEQLDFLREMMNVGAGNAAGALRQLLDCKIKVIIPEVHVVPGQKASFVLGDPSTSVVGVRMSMVGDVKGVLFFIVQDDQKKKLIELAQKAMPGARETSPKPDLSVLSEIGNMVAGVYMETVHDFCKLKIYHTVPTLATDMIQAILDEVIVVLTKEIQLIILVENEFIVEEHHIRTFFLMIPVIESVKTLVNSIEQARSQMGINMKSRE